MYTAFNRVSGLKLWSLGDCNCAILLEAQNSTITVTSGP